MIIASIKASIVRLFCLLVPYYPHSGHVDFTLFPALSDSNDVVAVKRILKISRAAALFRFFWFCRERIEVSFSP